MGEGPTDEAAVDREESLERVGGDPVLLRELAVVFLEDLPQKLAAMEAAIGRDDAEGLRGAAHSLKGAVSTFGAEPARVAALALEELGKSGDLAGAAEVLVRLKTEIARLKAALGPL